jgi:hypothetical protein
MATDSRGKLSLRDPRWFLVALILPLVGSCKQQGLDQAIEPVATPEAVVRAGS